MTTRIYLLITSLLWGLSSVAMAATLTVTNNNDSGPNSLRQAIIDASSGDTIDFSASLSGQTITLTSGDLSFSKAISIDASSLAMPITISGNSASRIFNASSCGGTFTLDSVVLEDAANQAGSAFYARSGCSTVFRNSLVRNSTSSADAVVQYRGQAGETHLLENVTLTNNSSSFSILYIDASGAVNGTTLTLRNVTLDQNTPKFRVFDIAGGAIGHILNSTVSNNTAGGVFEISGSSSSSMFNTTISNNTSNVEHVINAINADLDMTNTTITKNTSNRNMVIVRGTAVAEVHNSIISGNSGIESFSGDGTIIGGNNLCEVNSQSYCTTENNPGLAVLADNGGPTQTHALLAASPARDAGNNTEASNAGLTTDQRGTGFARVKNTTVDIGAFEAEPLPKISLSIGPTSFNEAAGTTTLTATASNASSQPITVNLGFTGTATNGTDYSTAGNATSITIPAGQTTATLVLTAIQDNIDELTEGVDVEITTVINGIEDGDQEVTGFIIDDDPPPRVSFSFSQASIPEASGQTTLIATASHPSSRRIRIFLDYSGTATEGVDYSGSSVTMSILPGETTGTLIHTATQDNSVEPDETIVVDISTVGNGVEDGVQQATSVIVDDDNVPTVTLGISPTSFSEAAGTTTLTATASNAIAQPITVNLGFTGTATNGTDYSTAGNATSITIAAGQTTGTLVVTATQDAIDEPNETVIVDITTVTNGTESGTQQVTGTITDDDNAPTVSLSISPASFNEAAGTTTLTATASNASSQAITVNLGFTGTATNGTDYSTAGNATSITIAAGQTTGTLVITATQDAIDEPNETVIVDITTVTNGTESGTQQVTGTITDDDNSPSVSLSISPASFSEAAGTTTLTATTSSVSSQPITVNLGFTGTATNGTDYSTAGNATSITIAAGQTTGTLVVTATQDAIDEPNETVIVDITTVTNGTESGTQQVTGTITDDDNAPSVSLSISPASFSEAAGTTTLTATASSVSSQPITVNLGFTGTASGTDYSTAGNATSITIAAGQTTGTLVITATQDVIDEPNETVIVDITTVTNGTESGTQQVTGTITDDDNTPDITLGISPASFNEAAGTTTLTATASGTSSQAITVNLGFSGTASGTDYSSAGNATSITIPAGQTTGTLLITATQDLIDEPNETVIVDITTVTNGNESGTQQVTGTIIDDDAVSLSVDDPMVTEGNSGTVNLVYTITQSGTRTVATTVDFATANGTATAGSDYAANSGTATISAGQTTTTVTVVVNGDVVLEPNETVFLNLTNASGVPIADNQGIGTITNDEGALTISVASPAAIAEGNSGTSNLGFVITLSGTSSTAVTVDYATSDGTATTSNNDYLSTTGTATIAAGQTSTTINVPIVGDAVVEPTENFSFNLSNPSGATINNGSATGTITNDEAALTLSINDPSVAEGNSGTTNLVYTITQSGTSSTATSVDFATANGTATAGSDYTAQTGPASIAAGQTTTTVTIVVSGDTIFESNETVFVNLSNASGASISDNQGVGTITNDEAALTISVASPAAIAEGDSGTSNLGFVITLSGTSSTAVTVNYATSDGTATTGNNDYQSTSGTATIAAGQTSTTVNVPVIGDTVAEPTESFNFTLSNPSGATISNGSATGTITNDEAALTLSINDPSIVEGNSGTTNLVFTITQSGTSSTATTVDFATANGSATAGSDYTAQSGTATIAAGQTSANINVVVSGDTVFEPSETVLLNLSNASGASINDNQGVGTITNDEAALTLSVASPAAIAEGDSGTSNLGFVITLSGTSSTAVTVNYATSDGTATTGNNDYQSTSGTATIAAGQTSATINVPVVGDTVAEPTESFTFTLSNPSGATINTGSATGTINNDEALTLNIGNTSVTEGDSGTVNMTYTISLVGGTSSTPVTFDYATGTGTATAGTDYTAVATTQGTIAAGATSTTVTVSVIGDTLNEGNETVPVSISNATGATIGTATGTGTINDDEALTLNIGNTSVTEGDSGSVNMTYTVSLVGGTSSTAVTFDYATGTGTATAGTDYIAVSTTQGTIAAGQTSTTINVNVIGDTINEGNETVPVTISNASGATIGTATGIGMINDDEALTINIGNTSVAEGDSGNVTMTYAISLVGGTSSTPVTFDYATGTGTATAGTDYTAVSTTQGTIAAGQTSTTITVSVIGDTINEGNETVPVTISNANGATIGTATGTGTINDDEALTLNIGNTSVAEGDSGNVNMTYTISLVGGTSSTPVTFDYATGTGTATAGTDYTAVSTTQGTIAAGQTSTTITVSVIGDTINEGNETVPVTISNANGATIGTATGTGTINDDEALTINIGNTSVTEGDSGTVNMTYTISLVGSTSSTPVTFDYATGTGTATAGTDYTAVSTTQGTIAAGATSTTITVSVIGDTTNEGNETVPVTISNANGATIGTATGTGTINDDETLSINIGNTSVAEGDSGTVNMTYTLSLVGGTSSTPVTFDYATGTGTATAGTDYTAVATTQGTIAAGQTSTTINVSVIGDTINEGNETVPVTISNANGATIGVATGTGTINDDEAAITLSINDVSITEGNSGSANATFTITQNVTSNSNVTVQFATTDVTATAGSDYTATSGTATIVAGQTSTTVLVPVQGDVLIEGNETFNITLSAASGATINDAVGVGTITNDDNADLTLSMSATPEERLTGEDAQIDFVITNVAASAAQSVNLQVFIHGNNPQLVVPQTCTTQTISPTLTEVNCPQASVAANGTSTVSFDVQSAQAQTIGIIAEVTQQATDVSPNNNRGAVHVTVSDTHQTSPDLVGAQTTDDIALADLDNDGTLDIVMANLGPTEIAFNDGTAFSASNVQALSDNDASNAVATGDWNNDGNIDFVMANSGANVVYLSQGTNPATFTTTILAGSLDSQDVEIADMNGDTHADLVFANVDGADTVWFGDGTGQFTLGSNFSAAASEDIALGDIDGDGDIDVVVADAIQGSVWLNDGSGNLTQDSTVVGPSTAVELIDLNGDMQLDILVARSADLSPTNLQNATPAELVLMTNNAGAFTDTALGILGTYSDIEVADVDSDGLIDVLLDANSSANPLLLNSGTSTAASFSVGDALLLNGVEVTFGQLNGDTDVDAVFANGPQIGATVFYGGNPVTEIVEIERSRGGGGSMGLMSILMLGLGLIVLARKRARTVVAASALAATSAYAVPVQHGDLDIGLKLGSSTNSVSRNELRDRFTDAGYTVQDMSYSKQSLAGELYVRLHPKDSNFGIEVGYFDSGNPNTQITLNQALTQVIAEDLTNAFPQSSSGLSYSLVGGFDLSDNLRVLGKVGVGAWQTDYELRTQNGTFRTSRRGSVNRFGVEVDWTVYSQWAVTANVDRFEYDDNHVWNLALGVNRRFSW